MITGCMERILLLSLQLRVQVPMVAFKDRVEDGKHLQQRLREEIIEHRPLLGTPIRNSPETQSN